MSLSGTLIMWLALDGKRKFLPSLNFQEPNQNSKNFDGQKLNIYYYIVGIKSLLYLLLILFVLWVGR